MQMAFHVLAASSKLPSPFIKAQTLYSWDIYHTSAIQVLHLGLFPAPSKRQIDSWKEKSTMAAIVASKLHTAFFHQRPSGRLLLGVAEGPLKFSTPPQLMVCTHVLDQNSQLGECLMNNFVNILIY